MIVVAIIGILVAIVFVSMSSAREKSKDSSARASMSSLNTQANICMTGGTNLTSPDTANIICSGAATGSKYPTLDSDWTYGSFMGCVPDLTTSDNHYTLCAYKAAAIGIKCTETSCVRIGF